ncbi:MAG: cation transport ATPase [Verrucomicrobiales bacterium]|mgnify:CR=1 FL=1|jgi:cation transport ATPase
MAKRVGNGAEDQRTFTALTLTIMNCACLLVWSELLFRYLMIWEMSLLPSWELAPYRNIPGLTWNLLEVGLAITVLAVLILVPAAWQFTKGSRGRVRMLLLVAFSVVISLGFSIACVRSESVNFDRAVRLQSFFEDDSKKDVRRRPISDFEMNALREKLEEYRRDRRK